MISLYDSIRSRAFKDSLGGKCDVNQESEEFDGWNRWVLVVEKQEKKFKMVPQFSKRELYGLAKLSV